VLADGGLYVIIPDMETIAPEKLKKFKYHSIAGSNTLARIDLESGNIAWRVKLGPVTPFSLRPPQQVSLLSQSGLVASE